MLKQIFQPSLSGQAMIQDFETFIRRGGNGAYTVLLRKDDAFSDHAARRVAFDGRLNAVARENEAMLLRALNAPDTPPTVTQHDLADPSDLRAEVLKWWDAWIGPVEDKVARNAAEERLLRAFAGALNEERQRALGIEGYVWRTRGDGKVRDAHAARHGRLFRWDDVPEGGHPGQNHNYRCVAEPVPSETTDGLISVQFDPSENGGIPPQDLSLHEDRGGHTVELHVGKSGDFLLRSIATPRGRTLFASLYRWRHGAFSSFEAAQRLTNANLARNADVVEAVATGRQRRAFITSDFSTVTGIEAYRTTRRASSLLRLRRTFGVGTVIAHAPDMPDGFVIITSYPRND